jgi:outer membrane protein TolC
MHLRRLLLALLSFSFIYLPLTAFAADAIPTAATTSADTDATITAPPPHIPTLTLDEAILIALRYNPAVRSAELQRILDKFNLRVSENKFELQYALTGGASYQNAVAGGAHSQSDSFNLQPGVSVLTAPGAKFSVTSNNPFAHGNSTGTRRFYNPSVTFEVDQPLMRNFGSDVTLAPLYTARDNELVAQLTLKTALITAITNVISQYITVMSDQNTIQSQQLSIASSVATYKQQQAMVKAGRTAAADLVQTEANIASGQSTLQGDRIQLQQDQLTLLNTLGLDPSTTFTLPNQVKMDETTPTLAKSIQIALLNNIAYQTALINLRVTERALLVAKDAQRWQLDLTAKRVQGGGSGGYPNTGVVSLTNSQNASSSIGLTLNIPIHDLSRQQQMISAKIALDQARISLAALKYTTENTVKTSYNNLLAQQRQFVLDQQAIKLAQQSLDIALVKLKYGRVTSFEVSSLQNNVTTAQLNYITHQTNYITTLANFDQELGTSLDRWDIKVKY